MVHPADVLTVVLAWLAALGVCVAAALFGQTARTRPGHSRRRSRRSRIGLLVSRSGPWLAVLLAAAGGALSGQWLVAAASGACGVAAAALVGWLLTDR